MRERGERERRGREGEREKRREKELGVLSHWLGAPSGRREGLVEMGEERSPVQLAWREAELQGESKVEVEVTARLHH